MAHVFPNECVRRDGKAFGRVRWLRRLKPDRKPIQFDWDDNKAAANLKKHGITFEVASSVFRDPQLLTRPDLAHSEAEERWFSIGWCTNGTILAVAYLWSDADPEATQVRLISARTATQSEIRNYATNKAYE